MKDQTRVTNCDYTPRQQYCSVLAGSVEKSPQLHCLHPLLSTRRIFGGLSLRRPAHQTTFTSPVYLASSLIKYLQNISKLSKGRHFMNLPIGPRGNVRFMFETRHVAGDPAMVCRFRRCWRMRNHSGSVSANIGDSYLKAMALVESFGKTCGVVFEKLNIMSDLLEQL